MTMLLENQPENLIEILDDLRHYWYNELNSEIVSIAFVQSATVAAIQLTFKKENCEFKKQVTNLDFISGGDGPLFDLKNAIIENVNLFIGLDGLSLIMCINDIFNTKGVDSILDPK